MFTMQEKLTHLLMELDTTLDLHARKLIKLRADLMQEKKFQGAYDIKKIENSLHFLQQQVCKLLRDVQTENPTL